MFASLCQNVLKQRDIVARPPRAIPGRGSPRDEPVSGPGSGKAASSKRFLLYFDRNLGVEREDSRSSLSAKRLMASRMT
jgi:hypothetical protein